ncbi:MAG: hypothetical protein FJ100_12935 [Deltaproteobacteria bacterium]|nr:hypothetical protein [Deltaproteobacteria bacterium]
MRQQGNRVARWVAAACAVGAWACGADPVTQPVADGGTGGVETAVHSDSGGAETAPGDTGVPDSADAKAEAGADGGIDVADSPDVADVAPEVAPDVPDAAPELPVGDTGGEVSKDATADATSATPVPGEYNATCTSSADCVNPCVKTASTCVAGKCSFKPLDKACLVEIAGGKVECVVVGGISKAKSCLACQGGTGKAVLSANTWLLPLDGPSEAVTIKDVSGGGISWNYSDKKAISGGKALWIGDPVKGTYANGKAVGATATTGDAKVPNLPGIKAKLNFWLWLDTEQTEGDDLLTVQVISGGQPSAIWTSDAIGGSTHGAWQRIVVDVSAFADKTVQFQLAFTTKDGVLNAFGGAYVDDLAVATGCCAADGECDDGNACTTDACVGEGEKLPVCKNTAKADCCVTNANCDDKKPCTLDLCSGPGGTCSHSDLPGCCMDNAGCDDKNACTDDTCPAQGGQCQHINKCCKADVECATSDPCKKGTCSSGQCTYADTCCLFNDDCDDFNPCTTDACDKGKCLYTSATVPGCCAPQVLVSKFDGSEEGWTLTSTHPTLKWAYKESTFTKSAPGALKMGDPTKDTSTVSYTNPVFKVTASSPAITVLPGKETTLSFWSYHQSGNTLNYTFRLYVVLNGVENTLSSFNYASMNQTWKNTVVDLTPLGGKSVELKFEVVATTTAGNYVANGIYLDDVVVTSTCQNKKCTTSANCPTTGFGCLAGVCTDGLCTYANSCCATDKDCNDSNLCTADACVVTTKKCSFTAIKGCCMGPGDCNDANACTTDVCPGPGGQCSNPGVPGCCLSSSQCDDKNACTTDNCVQNKCVNATLCCAADKDCADGETKCTTDVCVAGKCAHKPTGAPGCCEPDVWINDFDQGALKDITIVNSAGPGKGWQISASPPSGLNKSPPAVLWYGDPAKGTFDMGSTNGKATTPKILLPAATKSKLTLSLLMDTESGGKGSYDDMYVYLYVNNQKLTVWDKGTGVTPNKWYDISYDLSPHMGQEIQIEFFFNTIDSIGNGGKGVFIDDLKVTTDCGS